MPSFDTVLEPDFVELRNAVEQSNKEIGTRFDFKGSSAKIDLTEKSSKERELMLHADSDFQIGQVKDILLAKLAKRGVDVRFLDDRPRSRRPAATRCASRCTSSAASTASWAGRSRRWSSRAS